MSWWSRVANALRGERLSREIEEEMQSHLAEAAAEGREPGEARRAFGSALRLEEASREARAAAWLDSLRADVVFGWRQLMKKKVTSVAAILSLALGIGVCTAAFRLIDALLLRPLPVAHADRLYDLSREAYIDGIEQSFDGWAYPSFRLMRAAAKKDAELVAVSYAERSDVTYKSDAEMEKANVQYVSGWMFGAFGLAPAVGRLFTENDDRNFGAHPYAVLSWDYWSRRFGNDPRVVGRTLRKGDVLYEIVGVGPEPFTGTEAGTVIDIFLPATMHPGAPHDDWTWHRTLVQLKAGVAADPVQAKLNAVSHAFEEERAKGFKGMSKADIEAFLSPKVVMEPAASGASNLQHDYRRSLIALGVLVALVLLIACANVANLMTAQAASRAREMALRVSIGAGRMRLVQLVLMESAILAWLAGAIGAIFAWWSAPLVVVTINPADSPVRLMMPWDWRVAGFGIALTAVVMLLFGLTPALRASAVKPASALKGGDDAHTRRRTMHVLIAAQVAFCFVVLFVAGLFAATFEQLSHKPVGFAPERLLALDTVAQADAAPVYWDQVADQLRRVPGVEKVGIAGWVIPGGGGWNGFVSVNGAPPGPILAYFLPVSPGWLEAMKIGIVDGRDFRPEEMSPGTAMVNETFARQFFHGENPIGQTITKGGEGPNQVVAVVRDAPYVNIREKTLPAVYVPLRRVDGKGALQPRRDATFMVRAKSDNAMALASILRKEVPRARPEFRVSDVRAEAELVRAQTLRERLAATLAVFFAGVALLLASIGLYGVLDYTVLQRRREIGIRMAIGAPARHIARLVTVEIFAMVAAGAVAGLALGMMLVRYIATLLYGVKPGDAGMLVGPGLAIVAAALLAAAPAVWHALRIDPVAMLRQE